MKREGEQHYTAFHEFVAQLNMASRVVAQRLEAISLMIGKVDPYKAAADRGHVNEPPSKHVQDR